MSDVGRALVLDGNAVAGLLEEVFGCEMTACPCQCAHCGRSGRWPHCWPLPMPQASCCAVLRASKLSCGSAQMDEALYLDARGATYVKLRRLTA